MTRINISTKYPNLRGARISFPPLLITLMNADAGCILAKEEIAGREKSCDVGRVGEPQIGSITPPESGGQRHREAMHAGGGSQAASFRIAASEPPPSQRPLKLGGRFSRNAVVPSL